MALVYQDQRIKIRINNGERHMWQCLEDNRCELLRVSSHWICRSHTQSSSNEPQQCILDCKYSSKVSIQQVFSTRECSGFYWSLTCRNMYLHAFMSYQLLKTPILRSKMHVHHKPHHLPKLSKQVGTMGFEASSIYNILISPRNILRVQYPVAVP